MDRRKSIKLMLPALGLLSVQAMPAPQDPRGHLRVSILDRESGRPIPARCYLTDPTGQAWFPRNSIKYVKKAFGFNEQYFVAQHGFEIDLPPSRYTLVVERGPEYRATREQFEVVAGKTRDAKILLARWINMNARGWYSADLHNHRDWREMPALLLAEDLNLAPTITEWNAAWGNGPIKLLSQSPTEAGPAIRVVDSRHMYSIFDSEVERPMGAGTVDLVGLKTPIRAQGYLLSPLDSVFTEQVHHQGGYVDGEKILYREIPALVAGGQIDFAGIVHNLFNRHGVITGTTQYGMIPMESPQYSTPEGVALHTMNVYYKFLNCGFKLPVSAGSASGVMPSPLGYCRVYAHLNGKFGYRRWFQAVKAGHSFATNGPMLFFTVNGRIPGDTLSVQPKAGKSPVPLKVHAEASTAGELDRLEIVWKGQVIKAVRAADNDSLLKVDLAFDANESGWLAARAFEKSHPAVRFAQTSPVYIRLGEDLGIVPEDAKFFLTWIDRESKYFENLSGFHSEADRQALLAMFRKARTTYERLASLAPCRAD
jgi:hypothetical protein